jgi:hypothetical protein
MSHFKRILTPIIFVGGLLFLAACMPFTLTYSPTGYDETAAFSTVQIMLTEIEVQTLVARLTEGATLTPLPPEGQFTATQGTPEAYPTTTSTVSPSQESTVTATVTQQVLPTNTLQPTATWPTSTNTVQSTPTSTIPAATNTTQPTATVQTPTRTFTPTQTNTAAAYPTATATTSGSSHCNWASFVKDMSVPDRTRFEAMTSFTKTWRLKNIGTCTWNTNYALVFDSGNSMSGPLSVNLPHNVAPGETVDISVPLVAPGYPQLYTGYWKLKADDGTLFGIGSKAIGVFWVQIQVVETLGNSYVLFDEYCNASWLTNKGAIGCPGSYDTTNGSITRLYNFFVEGGAERKDQASLITIPGGGAGGFITGTFPPYHIKAGDHFHTHIGCLDDHPGCDISFTLSYLDMNGVSHSLFGPIGQTDDGYMEEFDISLDAYQNTTVQFVLTVQNNGSSTDDYAIWFYPIVWNN